MLGNVLSMSGLALGRSLVQFLLNLLVAAVVLPAQFGLIIFTTPFVIFLALISDMGLASAIVRTPDLPRARIEGAFGLMLCAGLGCAALLAAVAGPVEQLAAMPGLASLMMGMAVSLWLMIAGTVPRAMLERELRYRMVARIEGLAVCVGAGSALVLLWLDAGVWALVGYNIVANLLRLALFTRASVLRPRRQWHGLGPLMSFGAWVFGTNLLGFAARNADNLLIGAFLGSAALGLYGLAYQFMTLPLLALTWPASGVLLATLSRISAHGSRAARVIEGLIGLTALAAFPSLAYLTFGLAFPVAQFFSDEWAALPAILLWLAPVGALQSLAAYNGAILLAQGRARLHFQLSAVNCALLLATFLITLPYGLERFIAAYAIVGAGLAVMFLVVIVKFGGLALRSLGMAIAPALVVTVAGCGAALLAARGSGWQGAERWLLQSGTYGMIALAVCGLLRRRVMRLVAAVRSG